MGTKETVVPSTSDGNTGMGMKDVFKLLADDTGRVTSARLKKLVVDLDLDFKEEEIKEMISVVDPAGKGEITYKGLVGIVRDFNDEFPQIQLTTEEMQRELTVLLDESTTLTEETLTEETETEETNQANDLEETKEEEGGPENTKPGHVVDLKQICEEETDAVEKEGATDQEHEEAGEDDENETNEDGPGDESEEDANEEKDDNQSVAVSKPPSRMTIVEEHRLDSAISTAVGKMDANDSKSLKSTTSRKTMRSRSKSEGSILKKRGSLKSNSKHVGRNASRERSNSRTRNQQARKLSLQTKPVFKPIREPEYYSTIGCSLKLSQIRVKQRLLYIMWRVVYNQAMKKMEEEKRRQMLARREGKKLVKKRIKSM